MRKTLFALYFVTSALGFTQETVSTEILRNSGWRNPSRRFSILGPAAA
jgi:hypothetical protein